MLNLTSPTVKTSIENGGNHQGVFHLKLLVAAPGKSEVSRIRKILEEPGCELTLKQVSSLNSFVKSVGVSVPDLVIANYRFPGFEGVEALKYLRARDMKIPFVVVADSMPHRVAARFLEEGASACILKSDARQLREFVTSLVVHERRSSGDGPSDRHEYYEMLLDMENRVGTGFVVLDGASKRPLYVSNAFSQMVGYPVEEILNLTSIELLLHPDDTDKFERRISRLSRRQERMNAFAVRVTTGHGRTLELEFISANIIEDGGEKIAMIVKDANMVRQKVREKNLDAVYCEMCDYGLGFRSVVEDVKDYGLFTLDEDGKVKSWNPGIKRLLGFTDKEIIGVDLISLVADSFECKTRLASFFNGSAGARRLEMESWITRKDHSKFWGGFTLTTLVGSDRDLKGYSVLLRDLGPRKLAEDQLKESEAQLHSLAAHLQTTREEERADIARLLHDEFGQTLTALRMDLSVLGRMVSRTVTESLGRMSLLEKISSISEVLEKTIRSTRKIITDLRPAVLDELGLLTAIQWLVLEFENRTGIHCIIKRLQHDITLDSNASTTTFRILQEALNNVMRHSAATRVSISMQVVDQNIVLEIADNGKGIDPDKLKDPASTGIIGMRERVLSLGGEFKVRGETGKGTTLKALIPYSRNRAA